ncbi:Lysophospholipase L1 [Cyclonatronum proteinivorum]|uniref:Lysophospholipase L1 n=1 Tax=Cyclonatronum proteinivorum TaxID=1457365 RepID=A0A345UIM5_9BACT|nr:SGNH/GDSL hydrolase family protein [Cyclonatronum proteinivorum]AXJ00327.1 Lysophospholipase L1 [Cyclonatronum proteinivorum]
MAEPTKKEQEVQVIKDYLLPYLNLEKEYPLLPGAQSIEGVAAFIGLTAKELADLRAGCDEQAELAAQELLKDDAFSELTTRLPFKKGDLIVGLGDAATSDLQGWFEILRHVLEISRPELELRFLNAAVRGDSSYDVLRRLNRAVVDPKASWVFVCLGASDAMRLGAMPERTLVSLTDFWENLNTIGQVVEDVSGNPAVWVTPTPVLTAEMEKFALFEGIIDNADLSQFREVFAGRKGFVVDPQGRRFGNPPDVWNYLADGLHPSVAGHALTVKSIFKTLHDRKSVKSNLLDYGLNDDFFETDDN